MRLSSLYEPRRDYDLTQASSTHRLKDAEAVRGGYA